MTTDLQHRPGKRQPPLPLPDGGGGSCCPSVEGVGSVSRFVGLPVAGSFVGLAEGESNGILEGLWVIGVAVGRFVLGKAVGSFVGKTVGFLLGDDPLLGGGDGCPLGNVVGLLLLGDSIGSITGKFVVGAKLKGASVAAMVDKVISSFLGGLVGDVVRTVSGCWVGSNAVVVGVADCGVSEAWEVTVGAVVGAVDCGLSDVREVTVGDFDGKTENFMEGAVDCKISDALDAF